MNQIDEQKLFIRFSRTLQRIQKSKKAKRMGENNCFFFCLENYESKALITNGNEHWSARVLHRTESKKCKWNCVYLNLFEPDVMLLFIIPIPNIKWLYSVLLIWRCERLHYITWRKCCVTEPLETDEKKKTHTIQFRFCLRYAFFLSFLSLSSLSDPFRIAAFTLRRHIHIHTHIHAHAYTPIHTCILVIWEFAKRCLVAWICAKLTGRKIQRSN